MTAKITSKKNHDSVWVKVKFAEGEATVREGRGGITATAKIIPTASDEFKKKLVNIRDEMFNYLAADYTGNLGDRIDALKILMQKKNG